MKIITPKLHGYLDFLTVAIFLMAPSLLGLSGLPATIAYGLAVIHLAVTLITDFEYGVVKILPFKVHGLIERIVGPLLVALPFVLGFTGQGAAVYFYVVIGAVIIAVGLVTDYDAKSSHG